MTESQRLSSSKDCATSLVNARETSDAVLFSTQGPYRGVEELTGLTAEEAVIKAHELYSERKRLYEGFEVWDRTRFLVRYPESDDDETLGEAQP
jgi:hypothetical protein